MSHNAEPTRRQWMWIAVLDNRGPAALAGLTSLEQAGFRFFGEEMQSIHVVITRGATYHRFPGVKVHESRRLWEQQISTGPGVPHLPIARSALDAAAWQPFPRYACGLVAAVVQQKLCTVSDLEAQMRVVGRIRHKPHLRLALADIGGGSEALSELDMTKMCDRYNLMPPRQQSTRRDREGRRRYLDAEWLLPTGSVVVLEVDGAHHMSAQHWESDLRRERQIVATGSIVLRATANEVRLSPGDVAADLIAAGVPSGPSCQRRTRL